MIHVNVRGIVERQGEQGREIVLQTRDKPYEGAPSLELPGGRLEPFESFAEALRREVQEETGLTVTQIEGLETAVSSNAPESNVECLQPFAAYQTTQGPVDSMGLYFRCQAQGTLLAQGDDSKHPHWVSVTTLAQMLAQDPDQFSWVDRAGLLFYVQQEGV